MSIAKMRFGSVELSNFLVISRQPHSGQNRVSSISLFIFAVLKGKTMTKEQLIKKSQMLLDEYADGNENCEQMLEDALNLLNQFIELA